MSLIQKANQYFKEKNYIEAYKLYLEAQQKYGFTFLASNLEMCRKYIGDDKLLPTTIIPSSTSIDNKTVDIIVPVYNAFEDVKNCINSLYEHKTYEFNLIVIDDCSDKETENYLKSEAKNKNFKLLRNKENLRYTKTVNRGLKESRSDFVVLLNSDTIVTPRWIEKILACFESGEKIGIVGPLSNAARWQTVPMMKNHGKSTLYESIPHGLSINKMNEFVEEVSTKSYPKVPSVNGFCFVVKKEVINTVGLFDEINFPDGYGEEDDFSIRVINENYKIAVADDTYIYHAKSKSYTHELREKLSIKSKKALEHKYGKDRLEKIIKQWNEVDTLALLSKKLINKIDFFQQKVEPLIKQKNNKKISYQGKFEKFEGNEFIGWIVNIQDPADIFEISIYLDDILFLHKKNDIKRGDLLRHGKSSGQGGYRFSVPLKVLKDTKQIILKDPNNKQFAQIKVDELSLPSFNIINNVVRIPKTNNTSVIVPIYNAAEDLVVCIERLLKYTQKHIDIILIDDASPDIRISKILATVKDVENIRVFINKQNLGFTKTINKGIKLAERNDVVLLNSDARVTPRWLEGLHLAASTDAKIATVTPMSDRAGAFSAPKIGNDNRLPLGVKEVDYGVTFRRNSMGLYPIVPTGNGFCMFIKRACIDDIGALDEKAFPKGYGEENDFCMRARSRGWSNIIDDRTYVFHDRSKSFGDQKTELMKSGRSVVDSRYPDYKKAISVFSNSPDIALARFNASQALLESKEKEILPRVLYVISSLTGGTPQTNLDLMMALYDVLDPWLLYCDSKTISLYEVQADSSNKLIRQHTLKEVVSPLTHISNEYDRVLSNWLHEYDFEIVHIRHLARQSLSLPKLSKEAGAKVVYSMHDFYTLCPTIKLIDGDDKFCGGTCTTGTKKCRAGLWPVDAFPSLKNNWVHHWRDKFSEAIKDCDAYITTSKSAKETLIAGMDVLNSDNFHVIPHGRDFLFTKIEVENANTFDILIPGNINIAKGLNLIKDLLIIDKKKKLHFHILGNISMVDLNGFSSSRLTIHGKYKREEFAGLVKKIKPTVGAVLSIWDETWCHTLTELWAVGLPTIALDYGTISKRIKESGAGWVYSHTSIQKLYYSIIADLENKEEFKKRLNATYAWQETKAKLHTTQFMASAYWHVYLNAGRKKIDLKNRIAVVAPSNPSNKDSTQTPGSTYIRLWERTKNQIGRDVSYVRLTPKQLIVAIEEGVIDKAIIQRNILGKEDWIKIREFVKKNKFKYIFDIDDDLLNVPEDKDSQGIYKNYRPILQEIMKNATLITTSTSNLEKKYKLINKNIMLVPNKLSIRLWKKEANRNNISDNTFKAIYIGSNSHMEDFMMIFPALESVAKKYKNFSIKIIGITGNKEYNFPKWIEVVKIPDNAKTYPAFVNFIKKEVSDVNIAIAPLMITDFNNNKSALKLLEYSGLALPVIASKGIVYDEIANDAPYVLLVDNTNEAWESAFERSIEEKDLLYEQGQKMREWVLENHCEFEYEFDFIIKKVFLR